MLRITRATAILTTCVGIVACDAKPPPPAPAETTTAKTIADVTKTSTIGSDPQTTVALEDPCPDFALCRKHGACEFVDDDCRPTTTAHCAGSSNCGEQGRCVLSQNECQATQEVCAAWEHCPTPGKCGVEHGRCVVTEAACAGSEDCLAEGRCGVVFGICAPTEEKHCADSKICRREKKCFVDRRGQSARCGMDPAIRKSIIDRVNTQYGKKVRPWRKNAPKESPAK